MVSIRSANFDCFLFLFDKITAASETLQLILFIPMPFSLNENPQLIAIFSGLWPYAKQVSTLVLWFSPPTPPRSLTRFGFVKRLWPSSKRRGNMLSWLDALGKYSFIDIFVLVVAMVAFRISIESPSVSFLPDNFYSVDLVLVALYGLYFNMSAQILSQWVSHWVVFYHAGIVGQALKHRELERQASRHQQQETTSRDLELAETDNDTNSWSENNDNNDNNLEALRLCDRVFTVGDHNPNKRLKIKHGVKYGLIGLATAAIVFMIIGCSIPAFHFEILGLVGVVVESGQQFDRAIAYYSVFSICKSLIEQAIFLQMPAQYIGLGLLAIILVVTTLIMPLILVYFYLRLWFASMNKKQTEKLLFAIEIVKSWQYVEVFVLAVIIAAWQVGGLSGYMVNEYCGSLDGIFATLVQFHLLEVEDGQCFYVRSMVESGTYLLMAGAMFLAILSLFVTKAASQKLHEDAVVARRRTMSALNLDPLPERSARINAREEIESAADSSSTEKSGNSLVGQIRPVPIHFTDIFKCVMSRETTPAGSGLAIADVVDAGSFTTRTLDDLGESGSCTEDD